MDLPSRRPNYTRLSQDSDDQQNPPPKLPAVAGGPVPLYEPSSGDRNKGKSERNFDGDISDHRMAQLPGRAGVPPSIGLQRQSSGSSFGGSSISGEYFMQSDPDAFGQLHEDMSKFGIGGGDSRFRAAEAGGGGSSSSNKSWAQHSEESYQLQLALALRLSSEATCADDPNCLDPEPDESPALSSSAMSMSHRFWVNGCLSYFDRIPDGFYIINGMNPYIWNVCSDPQEDGRIPSIESLRAISPGMDSSIEATLIDTSNDPSLKELQNRIHRESSGCITTKEVVDQLAKIVSNHMGGAASTGEDHLMPTWQECSDHLKQCLGSVVLPIGSLSIGLCRHRALLFKVLADSINLSCRIAKGCKYCSRYDAASCLVRLDFDREYLVDLIGNPGCLCEPDSLLNGPSSVMISSPLCFPRSQQVEPLSNSKSLAKKFFADFDEILDMEFNESSTDTRDSTYPNQSDRQHVDRFGHLPSSIDSNELHDTLKSSKDMVKESASPKHYPPIGGREVQPPVSFFGSMQNTVEAMNVVGRGISSKELSLDVEDLDIPWSALDIKDRIGAGSFGVVHRADWQGSDVAVKILMDQDFHPERLKEFLREVAIMKRLRHPNIVLFMGAVTQPPNLSIVTEYLSRGSLYRLLQKPGAREVLDERRRLSMAYDVAKGMNYLHNRNPPIVHRDLKSPNLLVDKKYTVKVCDFGLSRFKANTFLSSKSAAGTPEWMAPEVLRDEPSNEKSDVYSFGVILWELTTKRQPWSHLNPAQVVAAVGFKGKRLEIPKNLSPQVASIIDACWASEPMKRPSFSSIMESLRSLIKSLTPQPVHADVHYLHE